MPVIDPLGQARLLASSGEIIEAIEILRDLVEQGDSQAMTEMAILLSQNRDNYPVTNAMILDLLHDATILGNPQAESVLNQLLSEGWVYISEPDNSKLNREITLDDEALTRSFPKKPELATTKEPTQSSQASASTKSLEDRAANGDKTAMATLALLYIHNPHFIDDPLVKAHQLVQRSIALGNKSARPILKTLAQEFATSRRFDKAESAVYSYLSYGLGLPAVESGSFNGLGYGDNDSVLFLLALIDREDIELKESMRKILNSHSEYDTYRLAQLLRKRKKYQGAEFWFCILVEARHSLSKIELATMYRREMKRLDKFNALVLALRVSSPYEFQIIQAKLSFDRENYTESLEFFIKALSINPESTYPLKEIHNTYVALGDSGGFVAWISMSENEKLLPSILQIAKEFRSMDDPDKEKEWNYYADILRGSAQVNLQVSSSQVSERNTVFEYKSSDNGYEQWFELGRQHIEPTYILPNSKFLKSLFGLGKQFCPLIENWMQYPAREEWLDEILAKYEDQSPFLKLEPVWPIRFESQELETVISVEGQWLRGWVGRKGVGGLVAIHLKDFKISSALQGEDRNFSIGVITSFFLDRTINLDSDGHPHFETYAEGALFGTSQFDIDVVKIRSGQRQAMQSHMVSGYPRKLPAGQKASDEAIMRAPIYIRRNLQPNQTFVRQHQRNGPVFEEPILRYLEANSNLADALGSVHNF
jgi:tetratricopeptide (TPR) repeat protein